MDCWLLELIPVFLSGLQEYHARTLWLVHSCHSYLAAFTRSMLTCIKTERALLPTIPRLLREHLKSVVAINLEAQRKASRSFWLSGSTKVARQRRARS